VKLARLTRGKESSSWPTATTRDHHSQGSSHGYGQQMLSTMLEKNWPTVRASEYKDVGPVGSKSHDHMLGKHYLCAVVTQDAANWSTPRAQEDQSSVEAFNKRADAILARRKPTGGRQKPGLTQEVQMHGQAAPASSSSLGSRQGLWLTPRANEPDSDPNFAARNADRGAHCHGTLSSQAKAEQWPTPEASQGGRQGGSFSQQSWKNADGLPRQMSLAQATKMWPTITAHTPDMESNGPNGHQGTYLAGAVKQWATPRSGKTTDENPETWALRQAKGDVATMPLGAQVKMWPTASVPNGGQTTSGRADKDTKKQVRLEQVERQQSGKLNPRWVETLMGLPIGWTMPSCTSPQTIAPMSCDSSAMELSRPPQSELSEFSLAS
jgi:hypothetical protein